MGVGDVFHSVQKPCHDQISKVAERKNESSSIYRLEMSLGDGEGELENGTGFNLIFN